MNKSDILTLSIQESVNQYLAQLSIAKSQSTLRSYKNPIRQFLDYLRENGINTDVTLASTVSVHWASEFFSTKEALAPATIRLYYFAIIDWYRYLHSIGINVNIDDLINQTRFFVPRNLPKTDSSPNFYNVSRLVRYALELANHKFTNEEERLRLLRDRALIVTLAESGLELEKVIMLRRGDIDWKRHSFSTVDRKGNPRTVNFSLQVADVLSDYLNARISSEKLASRTLSAPLFVNHGVGIHAKRKNLPLRERGVHYIVNQRAQEALGAEYPGSFSPRALLKFASSSALIRAFDFLHPKVVHKCQHLFEVGKYDDAIFNGMKLIEDEVRQKISGDPTDIGVRLISKAMQSDPSHSSMIKISDVQAEQDAAMLLFRGAIGSFKNPHSHRFIDVSDPVKAYECLTLASLLLRILDEASLD